MRPHTRTQCQVGGNCQECLPPSNNLGSHHHSQQQHHNYPASQPLAGPSGAGPHSTLNGQSASGSVANGSSSTETLGGCVLASSISVDSSAPHERQHVSAVGADGMQCHSGMSEDGSDLYCSPAGSIGVQQTSTPDSGHVSGNRRSTGAAYDNGGTFVVPSASTMTRSRSNIHLSQARQSQHCDSGPRNGMALRRNQKHVHQEAFSGHQGQLGNVATAGNITKVLPATRTVILVELPAEVLVKILTFLSFAEISQLRIVSRRFNEICASILNATFHKLQAFILQRFQDVKQSMPRRESARRNHPLAQECDIIETLHMRLTLLQMTFGKHIERKHICFFAGEILDETYRIMQYVKTTPNLGRSYKVTDELVDLSTMAMEYFKDKIECTLPDIACFGAEYLNFTTPYSSSLTPSKRRSGSASSVSSSCSSAETWSHVRLAGSSFSGGAGRGAAASSSLFALGSTPSSIGGTPLGRSSALAASPAALYSLGSSSTTAGGGTRSSLTGSTRHQASNLQDDDDDIDIYEDDEDLMTAAELLREDMRKIKQDVKKSSVATVSLKKQFKTVKVKVESQHKQFNSLAQRLDAYDKKMEDNARKFSVMLAELNKCRTELQFWRSRCLAGNANGAMPTDATWSDPLASDSPPDVGGHDDGLNGNSGSNGSIATSSATPNGSGNNGHGSGIIHDPDAGPSGISVGRYHHNLRHNLRRDSHEANSATGPGAHSTANNASSIGVTLRVRKASGDVTTSNGSSGTSHCRDTDHDGNIVNSNSFVGSAGPSASIRPLKRGSSINASHGHRDNDEAGHVYNSAPAHQDQTPSMSDSHPTMTTRKRRHASEYSATDHPNGLANGLIDSYNGAACTAHDTGELPAPSSAATLRSATKRPKQQGQPNVVTRKSMSSLHGNNSLANGSGGAGAHTAVDSGG